MLGRFFRVASKQMLNSRATRLPLTHISGINFHPSARNSPGFKNFFSTMSSDQPSRLNDLLKNSIISGNKEMVKRWLANGASPIEIRLPHPNPFFSDITQVSAVFSILKKIQYAKQDSKEDKNFHEIAKLLITHSSPDSLNLCDEYQGTPLHVAAALQNKELILALLTQGANPNIIYQETKTTPCDLYIEACGVDTNGEKKIDKEIIDAFEKYMLANPLDTSFENSPMPKKR